MKNMLEITISLSKETTSSKPQKNTTTNSLEVWATHSPSPLICTLNFSRQCVFIWSAIRLCAGKALVESSEGPKRGSQLIAGEAAEGLPRQRPSQSSTLGYNTTRLTARADNLKEKKQEPDSNQSFWEATYIDQFSWKQKSYFSRLVRPAVA